MTDKQKMILGLLKVLIGFSMMLFIIGIIMNYDGYEILRNQSVYKSGLLKVDSLQHASEDEYGYASSGFWGRVESVHTGITFGSNTDPEVRVYFKDFSSGKEVFVPVWYKPDGELTLERYSHENSFPVKRIWITILTFFMLLNFPLILLLILHWRLKLKYKMG